MLTPPSAGPTSPAPPSTSGWPWGAIGARFTTTSETDSPGLMQVTLEASRP